MSTRQALRKLLTFASRTRNISCVNNVRCIHVFVPRQHILLRPCVTNLQVYRFKSKKKKDARVENDSDDSDEENEAPDDDEEVGGSKVLRWRLASARADKVLGASGFGRKRVESKFYEGKLLLNGEKMTKKSVEVNPGDILDYVKEDSATEGMIAVRRVEIIDVVTSSDGKTVDGRVFKHLLVKSK